MTRFIAAAFLACTSIATPASAAPLLFDFVANNPSENFNFTLDSNPTISGGIYRLSFFELDIQTTSGTNPGTFYIYPGSRSGGFSVFIGITLFAENFGPQIYSGTLNNPSFSPGSYTLTGGRGSGGLLTIESPSSTVPEPATWTMILSMVAVGWTLRRRQ